MTAPKRAAYREPPLRFGALLRAFREQVVVLVRHQRSFGSSWVERAPFSQNALALRAGVSPSYVNKLEAGVTRFPARDAALRLADALELDEIDQARLIIAAGFWPWPECEDADVELAVRVLLSVVRGDYRRLEPH